MIQKPTPHHSSRGGLKPSLVIVHGDAGKTDAGTIAWLADPTSQVSYHYLIGRDGTVYQFVPESEKAWHAGVSAFHGEETGSAGKKSVNAISIGVSFANDGLGKEKYTEAQYKAGAELVAGICKRHAIPVQRIRSHADVSPGRKHDPWAWFDWQRFIGDVCGILNKDTP